MPKPSIVITSPSPRLRTLAEQLGLVEGVDFLMVPSCVRLPSGDSGEGQVTLEIAQQWAIQAARSDIHHAINTMRAPTVHSLDPRRTVVVGACTVAHSGDRILGRPLIQAVQSPDPVAEKQARSRAKGMLKDLSGKTVSFVTGLVVAQADNPRNEQSRSVITRAVLKEIADREIEPYVATGEPLDKPGALDIDGRGVVLLERIEGSYSNVLGLPLAELYELLCEGLFAGRVRLDACPTGTSRLRHQDIVIPELSVVSAGSTAAVFADAAQNAGFRHCSTIAWTNSDALLESIEHALSDISRADLFYLSGECLADAKGRAAAGEMLDIARRNGRITVLDVVEGMSSTISFDSLSSFVRSESTGQPRVDVLVSQIPDILSWFDLQDAPHGWDGLAAFLRERVLPRLRRDFSAVFLRTSDCSHELLASPAGVVEESIDSARLPVHRGKGGGERLTAGRLFEYMSPRILLASRSPQRLALLSQIVAPKKIEVRAAEHPEGHFPFETPQQRVIRLAREKALVVLDRGEFSGNIEILIAADTEVVLPGDHGQMDIVAHPNGHAEAAIALRQLSGREHLVITGIAVVGTDPAEQGKRRKIVSESVSTSVRFRRLAEPEILDYVESGECFGRAGAYAIQGRGALLVESVLGSYTNVVGLPLERLAEILDREFRVPVWDMNPISNWRRPRRLREM